MALNKGNSGILTPCWWATSCNRAALCTGTLSKTPEWWLTGDRERQQHWVYVFICVWISNCYICTNVPCYKSPQSFWIRFHYIQIIKQNAPVSICLSARSVPLEAAPRGKKSFAICEPTWVVLTEISVKWQHRHFLRQTPDTSCLVCR